MIRIDDLSSDDLNLLKHRTDISEIVPDSTICFHHKKIYLDLYSSLQRKCCNPFDLHKAPMTKGLRVVSLEQVAKLNAMNKTGAFKAGMKLCVRCRGRVNDETQDLEIQEETDVQIQDQDVFEDDTMHEEEFIPKDKLHEQLDASLTAIGVSPCKLPRLHIKERTSYIRRKAKQIQEKSQEMLCAYAGLPSTSLNCPSDKTKRMVSEEDMNYLIDALKEKLAVTTSKKEKISLLTIVPNSWTIPKTVEQLSHLGVTEYLVRRARKMKMDHGILPNVTPSLGRPLSAATKEKVIDFYNNDEISRILPGKKDYKTIREGGLREQRQKRLILMNLNEAYQLFKEKYTDVKIGISKFCELRPKECITVGASGSHSVCVCTSHQNVKLMLSSFPVKEDGNSLTYRDLLEKLVCSIDQSICMLHRCEQCPGSLSLHSYIEDY